MVCKDKYMNNNAFLISEEHSYRWKKYSSTLKSFLENASRLPDVSSENNTVVIYATPKVAYAKYIIPMINGKTTVPVISFTLVEETMNPNPGPVYPVFEFKGDGEREVIKFRHPIIKSLKYKCDLYTLTIRDADTILTQLEHLSNEYRPYYTKIDGQGTEYYIKNVSIETVLNPESGSVKVIHNSFNVEVPQAKLFLVEKEDDAGIVKEIRTKISYGESK